MDLQTELRSVQFASYPKIFGRLRELAAQYGDLPMDAVSSAFMRAASNTYTRNNPYIQNRRVKAISSLPMNYSKDKVAEMLTAPDGNEQGLRQVAHALEWTAYPLFHTRKVYTEMLTYHSYIAPEYATEKEAKREDFLREWQLLDKLRKTLDPKATAHEIAGQVLQEGKVFYYPRISVDKPHNKVNHAFLQQLPSDWVKIVGFNNVSKYTVAMNLMYFMQPGTDPLQFGDLLLPYLDDFYASAERAPEGTGKRVIFAARDRVDLNVLEQRRKQTGGSLAGDPEVYSQNGRWFYWVTLPVDKIFTFEADDVSRNAISPLAGLYLSLVQMAQYEQIQLELVQNPLIALFTGEIPYKDKSEITSTEDDYRLSDAGRRLFEYLWYQMLTESNTSGIGWFTAPVENIKMHQLAEAPSATKISAAGYSYAMNKAGLSAIVPTTEDPKAGIAQISLQIEGKFAECVYRGYERMMTAIMDKLNLKYSWRFSLFGTLSTEEKRMEEAKQGMTLGILPQTIIYMAMNDLSLLDDLSISNAIKASGIMDKRLPLVTSYNAKQSESGLPPQAAHDLNPGGRPKGDGTVTSEGQEADIDTYGE
jgi:hypothetical protein